MAEKTRTLFVIGSLGGGGSERQLIGILRLLDRSRFEPHLYLVHPQGELLNEVPPDVTVHSYWQRQTPPRWNFPGRILRRQIRHLSSILQRENIQVVYSRTYLMALLAGPAATRCGVPHVPVIVNDPQLVLSSSGERFLYFKRRLLRRSYRRSFAVATVSEGVREAAIQYYRLRPDHVRTVYNFLDLDRIDSLAQQFQPDFDRALFHVVSAGRFQPQKGQQYLLEAVADLVHQRARQQIRLHLFGQGPDESHLRELVEQRDLSGHVTFWGYKDNVLPYIRAADLFCLPSLHEGMPNALIEAIACRTPVLASDCPSGPREILEGRRWGQLVPPADSRALADAIENAMDQQDLWLARTRPADQSIRDRFSPATGIRRLEELLLEASRKPAS